MTQSTTSTKPRSGMSWNLLVRALRHRNYRLFFGGQGISLIGTWMTRVATGWLVYRLTGSAFLLGLVSFSSQIPILLLGPFAGVWVDRLNRHRVLVVTQALSMVQSFALAGLALAHIITVHEVILLNLFQGAINAFDMPARQAFLIEMVEDREDLGNAIALNSSLVNAARLIGPSVAGLLIAAVGEGYCFLIDGFSYVAVIASLLAMTVTPRVIEHARASVLSELREGWEYVRGFRPIWSILLLLAVISLVGMPYTTLMPIFAGKILHGGAHTLGFMMGAVGVGALSGAVRLAARRSVLGLGRLIAMTSAGFGAGLVAFSLLARALALAAAARSDWLLLHAANGVEQYDSADHHGGFETRACHELLLDRVPGNSSVWQPDRWRHREPHRSAAYADDWRSDLCLRSRMVRDAVAGDQEVGAADLPADRNYPRGRDGNSGCDQFAGELRGQVPVDAKSAGEMPAPSSLSSDRI